MPDDVRRASAGLDVGAVRAADPGQHFGAAPKAPVEAPTVLDDDHDLLATRRPLAQLDARLRYRRLALLVAAQRLEADLGLVRVSGLDLDAARREADLQ